MDDLITDGNHTATITLAYARIVRETGGAMRDTCFIFLVSDYIVADGALGSVLARVQDGASGVLAGNFQIVAEEAIPLLRHRLDPASPYISLEPRELMQWSLAHLHPATVANIVNARLSHNAHTNRLFWRVDQNTLLGRFYLMHMIAIRPEITDFVVGASCDYSFIPEMCPSGNVTTLTDSDDYLVVEMQPQRPREAHLNGPQAQQPPAPLLLGRHLIELGMQPGPRFKSILDSVRDAARRPRPDCRCDSKVGTSGAAAVAAAPQENRRPVGRGSTALRAALRARLAEVR
jgi:hypothetical protein